jgi:hypothetical protein
VADMREFDRVPRGADADPRAAADVLRNRAAQAAAARWQLAEVVGEAATEDGLLQAKVGAAGLRDLVIAPRAMRMPSTDLAAAIVELARQAREDLDQRRQELAAELGVARGGVDLDESLARLEQLRALVADSHGDMRRVYERFREQAEG